MKRIPTLIPILLLLSCLLLSPVIATSLKYTSDWNLGNVDASFQGEGTFHYSSWDLAVGGDINGDGYDDVLIGAWSENYNGAESGKVYLVLGGDDIYNMDESLTTANGSFYGEAAGDKLGQAVDWAGDVNGDGYDDLIMGAEGNDDTAPNGGKAYIFFGKSGNVWSQNIMAATADVELIGELAGEKAGVSVSAAGDVNGDGYDDVLIGAHNNSQLNPKAGKAYLVFGRPDSQWQSSIPLNECNASYMGEGSNDELGNIVAPAGDVNGDEYDDFLIGAYRDDESGGTQAGQTYLFLGRPGNWSKNQTGNAANASFIGEEPFDISGCWCDGAGDVNGDGLDDILIGARDHDGAGSGRGKVYLIFGKETGWGKNTDLSNADGYWVGESDNDRFGICVSGAGDVNGDGYDDMVFGASGHSSDKGHVYLMLGSASFTYGNIGLYAPSSWIGEVNNDQAGLRLDGGGDVNGDGFDDILIGSHNNGEISVAAGQTYLIYPATNYVPSSIDHVKVFNSSSYSVEIDTAMVEDEVFIEVKGMDVGASADTTYVRINSTSSYVGFNLPLIETGAMTGYYRGKFKINEFTDKSRHWIGASPGEKVRIESFQDPTKYAIVNVSLGPYLHPDQPQLNTMEDAYYSLQFTTNVPSATWLAEGLPGWLSWNSGNHTLWGTPTNADVGNHSFNMYVKDGTNAVVAQRTYTIRVNNMGPNIIVNFNNTAIEDIYYEVDFNSTDDGQGNINWTLYTDAGPWLVLDNDTGVLSGTPNGTDVGDYYVNMLVNDGNGGSNLQDFYLTVQGVNDPPTLVGTPNEEAQEDSLYVSLFSGADEESTVFTWSLHTNASFLELDMGNLSGTPLNQDVGSYYVEVTMTDAGNLWDIVNFTLTVHNTNDPPQWVDVPVDTSITVGETFFYDVNATDVDIGAVITYGVSSEPDSGVVITPASGIISFTPDGIGTFVMTVSASDSIGTIYYEFEIEVVMDNLPPRFTTSPQLSASVGTEWTYGPLAEDDDGDSILISLLDGPDGMTIASGTVRWTPTTVGNFTIKIEADDANEKIIQEFTIRVYPEGQGPFVLNRPPTITSITTLTATSGKTFNYQIEAQDPDGDDLIYSKIDGPEYLSVSGTGRITWTPTSYDVGEHQVTIMVNDGEYVATEEFTIVVVAPTYNGSNTLCTSCAVIFIGVPLMIMIILLIVIILVVRRKKTPEKQKPQAAAQPQQAPAQPVAETQPKVSARESDAIVPEVDGSDIFTQRERDRGASEALKSQGIAEASPIVDQDGPLLDMDAPDMAEEIPDVPPELMGETPPEILGDSIFDLDDDEDESSVRVRRPPLALPPAQILDIDEDPMMATADFTEVLLITKDGILLNHYASDPASEIDHDILSGMLTAVQAFVKDSFTQMDSTLKRLEMAEFTVLIEPGKNITAVGITKDRENRELGDHLLRMMRDIDRDMSHQFENWNGDLDSIRDVEIYIQELLRGGYEQ